MRFRLIVINLSTVCVKACNFGECFDGMKQLLFSDPKQADKEKILKYTNKAFRQLNSCLRRQKCEEECVNQCEFANSLDSAMDSFRNTKYSNKNYLNSSFYLYKHVTSLTYALHILQ